TTSMYLISLLYSNGSRLNANATRSLIPDMNISVLLNGKYYGYAVPVYYGPSEVSFNLSLLTSSANYVIFVEIANNGNVSKAAYPITVVNYNPLNPPPSLGQQIINYLFHTPDGWITLFTVIIPYPIYYLYKRARRKHDQYEADKNTVGNAIEAMTLLKAWTGQPLTPVEQAMVNAISPERQNQLLLELTSGKYKEVRKAAKKRLSEELKKVGL
ncbi:MAG: hypothetical protein QW393_04780, partial [Candidatus Micrarchaeaceae archaeon]